MAYSGLKNLADLDKLELRAFFDSFDNVLCDCDGVLWLPHSVFDGVDRSISKLKQIGKRVGTVTNNSSRVMQVMHERLQKLHFDIEMDDIVYPTLAVIHYLKNIGFEKDVYLLGCRAMRSELLGAGIQVAELGELFCEESLDGALNELSKTHNENIGAVVFDFDINCTFLTVAKAAAYLSRYEVLFIVGASDNEVRYKNHPPLLGISGFQKSVQEFTGRKPICLGKPGKEFGEYLNQKFNIKDSSRTLFVGDSLMYDIHFANEHGYQSLLVLTGQATLEDAQKCKEGAGPDFYVKSMADIYDLIDKAFKM